MIFKDIQFDDLDHKFIGTWPKELRYAIMLVANLLLIALVYFFHLTDLIDNYNLEFEKELSIQKTYVENYNIAYRLPDYENQLAKMRINYRDHLAQLPLTNKMEVVIEDISRQATANGIEVTLFKPLTPTVVGFINTQPIEMSLIGEFEAFKQFFANISNIERLITFHDFSFKNYSASKIEENNRKLILNVIAKTYWISHEEKKPV